MFVIAVYDISGRRVAKAVKIGRKYLNWVQNSVFEGELSPAKLEGFKTEMQALINPDKDSLIIYTWRDERYSQREIIGQKKGGAELII